VTRRFVVELDLCRLHDHDALAGRAIVIPKGFLKLEKKERKIRKDAGKKRHVVKRRSTKRVKSVDYEMTAAKMLGYANKLGRPFNGREAKKALKLSSDSVAHKSIVILLKQGKLKASGVGPARKLEVVKNGARAA
jgi:hypothetical protein